MYQSIFISSLSWKLNTFIQKRFSATAQIEFSDARWQTDDQVEDSTSCHVGPGNVQSIKSASIQVEVRSFIEVMILAV